MRKCVLHCMSYANNKGADQPAHLHSLISAFVVRCLDSNNISRFYSRNFKTLACFCGCTGRFVSGLIGNTRRHLLSCRGSFLINSSFEELTVFYTKTSYDSLYDGIESRFQIWTLEKLTGSSILYFCLLEFPVTWICRRICLFIYVFVALKYI